MYNEVRILGIIGLQVHGIIMRTIHAGMHHEDARFNRGAFTRIECHRTDGQIRGSASLQDFDIRLLLET